MIFRLSSAFLVISILASLLACLYPLEQEPEDAPSQDIQEIINYASILISCDSFLEEASVFRWLEVPKGGSFSTTLCSNPITGFIWAESARIDDTNIISQLNHQYLPLQDTKSSISNIGSSNYDFRTFKALKEGRQECYINTV